MDKKDFRLKLFLIHKDICELLDDAGVYKSSALFAFLSSAQNSLFNALDRVSSEYNTYTDE